MRKGGYMYDKLTKIRKENPNFDKKMVDIFADKMPKLLALIIEGEEYNNHIGSKDIAELAGEYIQNNRGEKIGFHWSYDEVLNGIKSYIDIDSEDVEFYPGDIFVWANVKYGDMCSITSDSGVILKYAIAELTDPDFPYYPASQRAYYWLKKHIEQEEK